MPIVGSGLFYVLKGANVDELKKQLIELQIKNLRQDTFEGRDYLVIPAILVREMVLQGEGPGYDLGPGFLPLEEIENSKMFWENIPIIINHTEDSARTRNNLENRRIGMVFDVKIEGQNLKADLWFDMEKMIELGEKDLLNALKAGEIIDVSTGYVAAQELKEGSHGGLTYNWIQRQLKPDHLAILPNNSGACSTYDGCGTNLNQVDIKNILSLARQPEFVGTETLLWNDVRLELENFVDGFYEHTAATRPGDQTLVPTAVSGMPAEMKNWIAKLSLLGDSDAETLKEMTFLTVVNPSTNKLNEGAVNHVLDGFIFDDIPHETFISAFGIARGLLKEEFGRDPGLVINKFKKWIRKLGNIINNNNNGGQMKFTDDQKKALISLLVNSDKITLSADELGKLECSVLQNFGKLVPEEKPTTKPLKVETVKTPELTLEAVEKALNLKPGEFKRIQGYVANQNLTAEAQKEALVKALVEANSTGLTEDQLKVLDITALQAFTNMAQIANYSYRGDGTGYTPDGGREAAPDPPAVTLNRELFEDKPAIKPEGGAK